MILIFIIVGAIINIAFTIQFSYILEGKKYTRFIKYIPCIFSLGYSIYLQYLAFPNGAGLGGILISCIIIGLNAGFIAGLFTAVIKELSSAKA